MNCPKCGSKLSVIATGYPEAYECKKCDYVFSKGKKTFVDE